MIVHLHVPKTAGTTFNYVLRKAYRGKFFEGIFEPGHVLSDDEARAFIESQRDMRAISSHALRYPCPPVNDLQYQYVTILREPVERVVSLYFHEKRVHAADPNHRSKKTLAKFIEIARQTSFGNSQCRHFDSAGDVVRAKHILDRLDFVGTTERFEEGLILARARLNLPFTALVQPRLNQSKRGGAHDYLDETTFQALRRAFEPDVELHAYAETLLARALTRQNRRFFIQTRALRVANALADREYRAATVVRGKAQGAKRRLTRNDGTRVQDA
jgi:hypothetical protein